MKSLKSIMPAFALAVAVSSAAYVTLKPQTQTHPLKDADDAMTALVQKQLKPSAVSVYLTPLDATPEEKARAAEMKKCKIGRPMMMGSGFVVDGLHGLIITNNHVAGAPGKKIEVQFSNGERRPARLKGRDTFSDIALIQVDVNPDKPLTQVTFGNSDTILAGRRLIAIGNPQGLDGSVTSGILSAKGRDDIEGSPFDDFLQTDTPINRGNSGGPLFDLNGELIGMNTAIYSQSGGSTGLGFAIPSNQIVDVMENLVRTGHMNYGMMGAEIAPVDQDVAQTAGLDKPRGALIHKVNPDSPAAHAGLRAGDIILSLNGKPVENAKKFPRDIMRLMSGAEAHITYWRARGEHPASVVLAERPEQNDEAEQEANDPKTPAEKEKLWNEFKKIPPPLMGQFMGKFSKKLQEEFSQRAQIDQCHQKERAGSVQSPNGDDAPRSFQLPDKPPEGMPSELWDQLKKFAAPRPDGP